MSTAGRAEGVIASPAIAAVSTAGYFGFLIEPPTIGFVAEALGLGAALFFVVILSALIVPLARTVDGKKPDGENQNSVR